MTTLEWNLEDCIKRCSPKACTSTNKEVFTFIQKTASEITLDDIIDAYAVIARIVTIYGDKYLPIFERLHREIEEHKMKNKMLNIARNVAFGKLSTDIIPNN